MEHIILALVKGYLELYRLHFEAIASYATVIAFVENNLPDNVKLCDEDYPLLADAYNRAVIRL